MNKRETKYWIITASKEHVKNGVTGGFAQACHGKSTPLKKMKTGDYVIYYSSKEYFDKSDKCQEFTAIGKVKNDEVYQLEISPDFCPSRLDIEFYDSKDISILPLINDLEFIINKQKWGYPFRWGILQINERDFKLISYLMLNEQED
ncbi:EVE domain-containing protein [Aquimarina sp. 2201CG5-10]|uniref:EVE domain-containing protein n=1 Tax=Aquimarina callyspongiae TaxID=3098150 RepID=UPI002AB4743E|nr:EVE domain-containing protein [Aquimarina sp. 2201CG5-10]MDY8137538.1 EVE domain-containing protein [Aquimarina sp. 2201CG5-10]